MRASSDKLRTPRPLGHLAGSLRPVAGGDRRLDRGGVEAALALPDRPSLLAIEFAAADLERPVRALSESGIAFARRDARIEVEPDEGFGCGVAFASAREATP